MRLLSLSQVFPKTESDSTAPFLLHWVEGLKKNGIDTTFLVPHNKDLPLEESWESVTVKRFRYGNDKQENLCYSGEMHSIAFSSIKGFLRLIIYLFSAYKATKAELKNSNYDALIIHWAIPSGIIAFALSLTTKQKYSIISHGTDIRLLSKLGFLKHLLLPIWKRAEQVYTVSNFLQKLLSLPAKVIPMPLPSSYNNIQFTPKNSDTFRILYVGRMSKQKRLHLLSEALNISQLPKHWKIRVIGDGITRNDFLENCKSFKSQLEIYNPVSPSELPNHYRKSNIVVLPSEDEGFGLVLIEAMAYGCWLAGANSGAIPEIISENKNGNLFSTASELRNILEKCDTNKNNSEHSTKWFNRNYNPTIISQKWANSLKDTI